VATKAYSTTRGVRVGEVGRGRATDHICQTHAWLQDLS
jgi:hypothetical protein